MASDIRMDVVIFRFYNILEVLYHLNAGEVLELILVVFSRLLGRDPVSFLAFSRSYIVRL